MTSALGRQHPFADENHAGLSNTVDANRSPTACSVSMVPIYQDPLSPSSSVEAGGKAPSNVLRNKQEWDRSLRPKSVQSRDSFDSEETEEYLFWDSDAISHARRARELFCDQGPTPDVDAILAKDRERSVAKKMKYIAESVEGSVAREMEEKAVWRRSLSEQSGSETLSSMIRTEKQRVLNSSTLPSNRLASPSSFPISPLSSLKTRIPILARLDPYGSHDIDISTVDDPCFRLHHFSPSTTGILYTVSEILCILWYATTTTLPFCAIAEIFNSTFPSNTNYRPNPITKYDVNRVVLVACQHRNSSIPFFTRDRKSWHTQPKLQRPELPYRRVCYFGINCDEVRRKPENDKERLLPISRAIWDFPSDYKEFQLQRTHKTTSLSKMGTTSAEREEFANQNGDEDEDATHICLGDLSTSQQFLLNLENWHLRHNRHRINIPHHINLLIKCLRLLLVLTIIYAIWKVMHTTQDAFNPSPGNESLQGNRQVHFPKNAEDDIHLSDAVALLAEVTKLSFRDVWQELSIGAELGFRGWGDLMIDGFCTGLLGWSVWWSIKD